MIDYKWSRIPGKFVDKVTGEVVGRIEVLDLL